MSVKQNNRRKFLGLRLTLAAIKRVVKQDGQRYASEKIGASPARATGAISIQTYARISISRVLPKTIPLESVLTSRPTSDIVRDMEIRSKKRFG